MRIWLPVLSILLVLSSMLHPLPRTSTLAAAQERAPEAALWLTVFGPTEAHNMQGEELYQAEPGDWYEVIAVEDNWVLARWEHDTPENLVWLAHDERIEIIAFAVEEIATAPAEPTTPPTAVAIASPVPATATAAPPPTTLTPGTPVAAPAFTAMLQRAKSATYVTTYAMRVSVPVFAANATPGPGSISSWANVSGTMTWYVQHPNRRFEAVIQEGAQHLDPRRIQPGMVPDPQGRTPTFYVRANDAVICVTTPEPRCDEVDKNVALDLLPLFGRIYQNPLIAIPFVADINDDELGMIFPADRPVTPLPSRQILAQPTSCYAIPVQDTRAEVCFNQQGVPLRIGVGEEGSNGSWTLVATNIQTDVPAGSFDPPSPPRPRPTLPPNPR